MNNEQKIDSLKKKEIATLFLIGHGQTNDEISVILNEHEKTTSSRITRIYQKLNVIGEDSEKRKILLRDFCPIVNSKIKTLDDLRYWIPKYPSPEVEIKYELMEKETINGGDTGDGTGGDVGDVEENINYEEIPFLPPPSSTFNGGGKVIRLITLDKYIRTILIGIAIIFFLIILVVYLVQRPPEIPLNIVTQTPYPTYTLPPTYTPFPSPTVRATEAVPAQLPTTQPVDTPIPTVVPKPTEVILYHHDFADGYPSDWNANQPLPPIVDGILAPSESFGFSIGDDSWQNYRVKLNFTAYPICVLGWTTVVIRAKSNDNGICFYLCEQLVNFVEVHRGSKTVRVKDSQSGAFGNTFTVDAVGDNYTYSGKTLTIPNFPKGIVYINLRGDSALKEITVYQLP